MEWFFKPKVQVGLFINFAFVMFTLVSSPAGAGTYVTSVPVEERDDFAVAERREVAVGTADAAFRYVPLPPRVGPSQAASYRDQRTGQISVYATHEFTLVKKDGRTLTLWPIFYLSGPSITPPRKVLLRFTSSAPARFYSDECELEISAEEGANFSAALPVTYDRASTGGAQGVVQAMGQDIPYPVFLKLVTSKRVTFKVGSEEIALTEAQLNALRDMQRCIQDGVCG